MMIEDLKFTVAMNEWNKQTTKYVSCSKIATKVHQNVLFLYEKFMSFFEKGQNLSATYAI